MKSKLASHCRHDIRVDRGPKPPAPYNPPCSPSWPYFGYRCLVPFFGPFCGQYQALLTSDITSWDTSKANSRQLGCLLTLSTVGREVVLVGTVLTACSGSVLCQKHGTLGCNGVIVLLVLWLSGSARESLL